MDPLRGPPAWGICYSLVDSASILDSAMYPSLLLGDMAQKDRTGRRVTWPLPSSLSGGIDGRQQGSLQSLYLLLVLSAISTNFKFKMALGSSSADVAVTDTFFAGDLISRAFVALMNSGGLKGAPAAQAAAQESSLSFIAAFWLPRLSGGAGSLKTSVLCCYFEDLCTLLSLQQCTWSLPTGAAAALTTSSATTTAAASGQQHTAEASSELSSPLRLLSSYHVSSILGKLAKSLVGIFSAYPGPMMPAMMNHDVIIDDRCGPHIYNTAALGAQPHTYGATTRGLTWMD